MPKRKFSFVQLDVFTSRPLEGNQLAVFSDARGLSDDEMQKLARETNLSETTYILPRDADVEQREGHKVRIFTVSEELPFAGHPTLGTAWYLRQHSSSDEIVLDLKVGKIAVRFAQRNGLLFGVRPNRNSGRRIRTPLSPRYSVFPWQNSTRTCPSRLSLPACLSPWSPSVR